jgi:PhnB protein
MHRPATTKEDPMASRLNPYINFTGNATQAMEFYKDVFGGSLTVMTYADAGASDMPNPEQMMHGMLETDSGYTLMASDLPPGVPHNPGDTISVSLSGDDGDDLRRYWAKLSASGTVSIPLEKQMWGDEFGACRDQFGINWLVNISQASA